VKEGAVIVQVDIERDCRDGVMSVIDQIVAQSVLQQSVGPGVAEPHNQNNSSLHFGISVLGSISSRFLLGGS